MHLDAYDLSRLDRALAEMSGDVAPSAGARGQTTPATVTGVKRNTLEAEVESDGRLAEHELNGVEPHALIDAEDAVLMGLITARTPSSARPVSSAVSQRATKRQSEQQEQTGGTGEVFEHLHPPAVQTAWLPRIVLISDTASSCDRTL